MSSNGSVNIGTSKTRFLIHPDAITLLTLKVGNGNEGRTVYFDDLRSNGNYLTTPTGSTIPSNVGERYFQYRAILHSSDETNSTSLTSTTVDYAINLAPNIPTLDAPVNGAGHQLLSPVLRTTSTDTDSDYLRYKIELCTNLAMTTGCQTFDQTISQTGWSGQNTQSSTAYTSGTQATYTVQTPLIGESIYYWRSYAVDPAGTNTFGSTQVTPYSFTTNSKPNQPTLNTPTNTATNQSVNTVLQTTSTDFETDYLRYKIEISRIYL